MRERTRAIPSIQRSKEEAGPQWQATIPCKFQQLPHDTVMDILSRLPIKALFECRCVCKLWLHLISDPQFAKLHLARSPINILIKTIPPKNRSRTLQVTQLGLLLSRGKMKFIPKINLPTFEIQLVRACNGLLCLLGQEKNDPIYVCNPVLGEYITIPPPNKGRSSGDIFSLGFSAVTDQYKVLQTFYPLTESRSHREWTEAEIYTIGTGAWRSIGKASGHLLDSAFNTFVNGALHWLSSSSAGCDSEIIHSFDLESECFGIVPPPPHFGPEKKELVEYLRLGVLGDCLCIISFDDTTKFDIWVMKEYGIKESWTKQFVVEHWYPKEYGSDSFEPIISLKRGEIVMLLNDEAVLCYNLKSKNVRDAKITQTRSYFHAIAYNPCFVSLYDVAKGEDVKVVRTRRTGEHGKFFGEGIHVYAGSGTPLNKSAAKFISGCGCPAFQEGFTEAINRSVDQDGSKSEITCAACSGHLGNVF